MVEASSVYHSVLTYLDITSPKTSGAGFQNVDFFCVVLFCANFSIADFVSPNTEQS